MRNSFKAFVMLLILSATYLTSVYFSKFQEHHLGLFNLGEELVAYASDKEKVFSSGLIVYPVLKFIEENINEHHRVLVFRKSEISRYTSQYILHHNDPFASVLFEDETKAVILKRLHEKQVKYILQPHYPVASIYNSTIGSLLGDSEYTKLLVDNFGVKLFEVREEVAPQKTSKILFYDPNVKETLYILNRHDPINRYFARYQEFDDINKLDGEDFVASTDDDFFFLTGEGLLAESPALSFATFTVIPGIYKLEGNLEGEGRVSAEAYIYDDEKIVARIPVWQGILRGDKREFTGQFLVPYVVGKDRLYYRLVFKLWARAKLKAPSFQLSHIDSLPEGIDLGEKKFLAEKQGWYVSSSEGTNSSIDYGYLESKGKSYFQLKRDSPRIIRLNRILGSPKRYLASPSLFNSSLLATEEISSINERLKSGAGYIVAVVEVAGKGAVDLELKLDCQAGEDSSIIDLSRIIDSKRMYLQPSSNNIIFSTIVNKQCLRLSGELRIKTVNEFDSFPLDDYLQEYLNVYDIEFIYVNGDGT